MKIAFLSIMDNGNWCRHMARGLRDYCNIKAQSYALDADTYLNIPDDTVNHDLYKETKTHEAALEAIKLTMNHYDMVITNDHTYFQFQNHIKKPCIIKCNGTFARKYGPWFEADRIRNGNLYITSNTDYTLAAALGFSVQTIGPVYDHRLLPKPAFDPDKIVVGHAPTGPSKGTQEIAKHLQKYRRKKQIEIDFITKVPWKECIERKSRCHIFIDQVNDWGAFGINTIESLALGSIVLNSPLHPYVTQHFSGDFGKTKPIKLFPDQLEHILTNQEYYTATYRHWVKNHFDISNQAPRLKEWILWLMNSSSS